MAPFFAVFAMVTTLSYLFSLLAGHGVVFAEYHLILGVVTAILVVAVHSLIFAIFTGSGKDTRLLVADLGLETDYVKRTKRFKRTVFPPALYAIFWVLLAAFLGGALSSGGSSWVRYAHLLLAWGTFLYNVKVFILEYRAIAENGRILGEVNAAAARQGRTKAADIEPVVDVEWGSHVFAFGRFLCFLAYNCWLPYLYFRFIVGYVTLSFWPFLAAFVFLWMSGRYLKWRYQKFGADLFRKVSQAEG